MDFKCNQCPAKYSIKGSLNKHILRKHKNVKKNIEKIAQVLKCEWCTKEFRSEFKLQKHVSQCTHNEFNIFKCNDCGVRYTSKPSLKYHIIRRHLTVRKSFPCDNCGRKYWKESSLQRHIRSCNAKEDAVFECAVCGKQCKYRHNLVQHIRKQHDDTQKRVQQANLKCSLCGNSYFVKDAIIKHFQEEHDIRLNMHKLEFYSLAEFKSWLLKIEDETKNTYIKSGPGFTYRCHRSGFQHKQYKGERSKWLKGTKKIDGYCPSEVKCTVSNDATECPVYLVRYVSTHVAHGTDIQFMTKIKHPKPVELTLTDGTDALVNFDSWLVKRINTAFYCKKRGQLDEQHQDLKHGDYVLILMNEDQAEMLSKYGNDVIMVGGTHANEFTFELTIIMVLDELRQEVPVCFMFSNRKDEYVYEVLFGELNNAVPKLKPSVFLSNMRCEIFFAFKKVIDTPEKHLFCSWCVTQSWTENVFKVKGGVEKRRFVSAFLKKLQTELDPLVFDRMLQSFLDNVDNDADLVEFIDYFRDNYKENVTSWAYCYRLNAGVNFNMYAKNFVQELKKAHFQKLRVTTLNDLLPIIEFVFQKFYLVQFIKLKKARAAFKVKSIKRRHQKGVMGDGSSVVKVDNGWYVPSKRYTPGDITMENMYFVETISQQCNCKLKCFPCGLCAHQIRCSCMDYSIKSNLCEHIHLVGKLRLETVDCV